MAAFQVPSGGDAAALQGSAVPAGLKNKSQRRFLGSVDELSGAARNRCPSFGLWDSKISASYQEHRLHDQVDRSIVEGLEGALCFVLQSVLYFWPLRFPFRRRLAPLGWSSAAFRGRSRAPFLFPWFRILFVRCRPQKDESCTDGDIVQHGATVHDMLENGVARTAMDARNSEGGRQQGLQTANCGLGLKGLMHVGFEMHAPPNESENKSGEGK